MFEQFTYTSIPLKDIGLDDRNPRIVTQTKLGTQFAIVEYLYEHEGLEEFVKKLASEGKNAGAERPYVVPAGAKYTVIEGNSRIAAYKVLTGLMTPPKGVATPLITDKLKQEMLHVDCSVAPNRDALMPIMASAHFGLGDKSKWGYLGSRKAVYDEWKDGKTIAKLAKTFGQTPGEIKELILEYLLYLKALGLSWSKAEKDVLLNPQVQFNPPVRFLQSKGHKEKLGVSYDSTAIKVIFVGAEAPKRFKHLIKKLVISPAKGLGATASYDEVFNDYAGGKAKAAAASTGSTKTGASSGSGKSSGGSAASGSSAKFAGLFAYDPKIKSALIAQLMSEARTISLKKFPAATTFLLRNVVESILKEIIHKQNANPAGKQIDLEGALNICATNSVALPVEDKKVLAEFRKHHLNYVNLGAHGNVVPNPDRTASARDSIDQFVKRNV